VLDVDVAAIPSEACVRGVTLRAPGIPGIDRTANLAPPAVIVVRLGILGIVAEGKLPIAVDGNDPFAQVLNVEDSIWRGFGGRGRARLLSGSGDSTEQDERSAEDAAPHTASISPVRWRK
jgi:hypothetical protein